MADLYGLEASGLPPELIARLTNSREGMKVAEALLAQSMRPVENMGGPGASLSWTQGAAKIAEALLGQRGLNQAAAERSAVAGEAAAGERAAMEAYHRQAMGVPGVTPSTPMDDEGNVMPSTPAVPGDPMGAVVKARMSPYLKNAKFLDSAEANINRIAAREDAQANTRELRQMQQDQRQWEVKQAHQSKMEQIREAAEQGRITQAQRLAAEAEAKKQHAELLRSLRPEPAPITHTDAAGNVTFYDRAGNVIKRHEGAGKPSATFEKTQAEKKNAIRDLDSTISELKSISEKGGLLDQSTGSGIGRGIDMAAGLVGIAPDGAVAAARLAPIADKALKMVPRFEGPQSDKDTQSYKEAAGQLANASLPPRIRKAAALEIVRLMEARRGQFAGEGGGPAAPPSIPRITDDAGFAALPSGTKFIDPEGNTRTKP